MIGTSLLVLLLMLRLREDVWPPGHSGSPLDCKIASCEPESGPGRQFIWLRMVPWCREVAAPGGGGGGGGDAKLTVARKHATAQTAIFQERMRDVQLR